MLEIYNSLTRSTQPFRPIREGQVRMYVCGITVYDYLHLGHARMLVVFDLVRRWLRASGYRVTYVRNITDIEDKIIRRARENGEPVAALTQRFIDAMDADAEALGVEKPDHEPRATAFVPQMQRMIAQLEDKGLAYRASDGDVNFAVRRFPDYGRLSGRSLDELRAGERVEVVAAKRDPLDFVLWKHSKADEPAWDSPWGAGRPGWHIECSAMSCALLGEHFDIHGGGEDLKFPHHENEIAQSVGALGGQFVNVWMHNGFVRVDEEKMSKSLGNFFTVREILRSVDPEVVRFFILRAHYRSPLNYSDQHLNEARQALTRLYLALGQGEAGSGPAPEAASEIDWGLPSAARFRAAMDSDFGTPEAVAVLFELASEINRGGAEKVGLLRALGGVLGLLQRDPREFLQAQTAGDAMPESEIENLVRQRRAARAARDFGRADEIRAQLERAGVILEDGAGETRWRRA